jgi:hypothetical protein
MDDLIRDDPVAEAAVHVVRRYRGMEPAHYSPCEWYTDQEGALGGAESRARAVGASDRPVPRERPDRHGVGGALSGGRVHHAERGCVRGAGARVGA